MNDTTPLATAPLTHVTASMEVFQELKKTQTPKPVTITLQINPLLAWPHSMRVALLHLANQNGLFSDYDTFTEFKKQMETLRPIDQMASDWASQFDKDSDPWKIIKYATSSPKQVVDEPPYSCCPRCGEPVWGSFDHHDKPQLLELYRKRPYPEFCLKCGQRFKYDSGRLSYTAAIEYKTWERRLSREAGADQPSLTEV
ncbi:MAG: hypothetical protein ABF780_05795 [Bifidobacterium aquikefiri]|uniref:Uncharacterized protein n=1 Tax=Bifidobacterium aquikefiri TaxID=1653207 RepID=A0A261G2Q8_9BIFI|nr:hypothetical protein [Bifidobacterium aquikefiri]OZG65525.1 hypothetical protein BAQU_1708 [Bifidobacterium aquikefiri]